MLLLLHMGEKSLSCRKETILRVGEHHQIRRKQFSLWGLIHASFTKTNLRSFRLSWALLLSLILHLLPWWCKTVWLVGLSMSQSNQYCWVQLEIGITNKDDFDPVLISSIIMDVCKCQHDFFLCSQTFFQTVLSEPFTPGAVFHCFLGYLMASYCYCRTF